MFKTATSIIALSLLFVSQQGCAGPVKTDVNVSTTPNSDSSATPATTDANATSPYDGNGNIHPAERGTDLTVSGQRNQNGNAGVSPQQGEARRPRPTPQPRSLLARLYDLIWPAGQYKENLAREVTENSQQGSSDSEATLYLVMIPTGILTQWHVKEEVADPVVSPDGKYLFYRLGVTIYFEELQVGRAGVRPASNPQAIKGVEVQSLYACTHNPQRQPELWVEHDGQVRLLHPDLRGHAPTWATLPAGNDFEGDAVRGSALKLRKLRSLRPDGYRVWVENHHLLWQDSRGGPKRSLDQPALSFFGTPAWVSDSSPFVFVTAKQNDR